MKILIVTSKYYPDTFPINLIAERLNRSGNEVNVLTTVPFTNNEYIDAYNKDHSFENGVNVYRVKTSIRNNSRKSLVRYYLSLHHELKKWIRRCSKQYDLVYSYSISPVISLAAGNLYKKKFHVPHVAHILDIWPESVVDAGYIKSKSLYYKFLLAWSKKEYKGLDKLYIGSKAFKEYLIDKFNIEENKIEYLVQPGLIYEEDNNENPYDASKTNLVYCGNISKLQLVDYIVPLVETLNNKDVVINILGTGSYLDELEKEIKSRNIKNVIYHGYYDYKQSKRYLYNADAIIVSLKNVGFVGKTIPNKLISALYYGKPIIGMIEGEGREILQINDNIIVDESVDDFVNGINKFLNVSKEDRLKMGIKNRQLYDDQYSLDKFVEKLLSSLSCK